jgi:hypothetical protein
MARRLGKEHFDCFIELLMELGAVLKADGWEGRLQEVEPGTEAKTLALATLRQATDGNTAAVEELVHGAIRGF